MSKYGKLRAMFTEPDWALFAPMMEKPGWKAKE